ncbi:MULTISPECIES: glycosyltransferase 87 family protein [unclassified Rathayibacter]|uniref:glycosyltransferase 87 family protein n=1 Tax=unclassified Rathayibacter TaxID=2609250 RepID=UPI00188C9699|nr:MULTISPECIES: glycosyltransferase 87 family protein [unclassified Rathayibacter]MBF4463398.1 DUF2029 domain-containing protein [Rathayibacter sp. VKM Ac-2879]MBF4504879.1 DUF2029 domain-containing protein [Rathayibacter sp. VKM Ac-2878]
MPTSPPARVRLLAWLRENRDSASLLWSGFALVHVVLSLLALYAPGLPMGDVSYVYKEWMRTAVEGGGIAGIDSGWVYPILAWAPIAASWLFGAAGYDVMWLLLVALADAAAFALLLRGRVPLRLAAARWWLLFLVLLGPIAIGRIDAFTAPPAIAGMLWMATRPAVASLLLTVGTWIKVWPAAILAGAVLVLRGRVRMVVVAAIASAVLVLAVVLAGGGAHVFSFVTDQTSRGLQIEAVVSTPWMWLSILPRSASFVWYAADINTFEMHGPFTTEAAALMTPLLAVAMLGVALLGLRALRAGVAATRLFPLLALTLVVVFIDTNKVLSPQYIVWLAPPVIAGLVAHRDGAFATPAKLTLVIAALTQVIYPYLYLFLLYSHWYMVLVLTVRNVLLVVLLGWLVRELWRVGSTRPFEGSLELPTSTFAGAARSA